MEEQDNSRWVGLSIELLVKLGALAILLVWCYRILEPFLIMIVWGSIIAVASFPLYDWVREKLQGAGWHRCDIGCDFVDGRHHCAGGDGVRHRGGWFPPIAGSGERR